MSDYPLIADHGMIGDLQTAALVSNEGVVDWWCTPRFDSPSVFASLLDHERGGSFQVTADRDAVEDVRSTQLYLPDTAVLLTRFLSQRGVGELVDFMPVDESAPPTDRHRLVRAVRGIRGRTPFTLACRPRFDYGRGTHTLELISEHAAVFRADGLELHLQSTAPITLQAEGNDIVARFTLDAGQDAAVELTSARLGGPAPGRPDVGEIRADFEACRGFWYSWLQGCTYRGRWQQMVHRSAITLKLLTYAPTGAPIAAATMGLPEELGGERNWDYRFTWVRDASLSVHALISLGFTREALAFRRWLRRRLDAGGTANGEPLQIMYRVDGEPHLTEETLGHLRGYRGSAPVRAGNAAADQIQLDIYGEAAFALAQVDDPGAIDGWRALARVIDWLSDHWDRPDEGIWETRGGRHNFTFSRLMCWVAFDRAIRMATAYARPANLSRWIETRDAIFNQIVDRGWHPKRHAFVQHYDTDVLDASLLLMPIVGFMGPSDPAWQSTLDAMRDELVSDSLVYRYNPETSPDGLAGGEGTFSLCSFLYVAAMAQSGRVDEARYAFDKALTYANHVGLFAEEICESGEQLGNFPQAFTHIALIEAAVSLDTELDRLGR